MLNKHYVEKFKEILDSALYLEQDTFCIQILLDIKKESFVTHYKHWELYEKLEQCQLHTNNRHCSKFYQQLMNGILIELNIAIKLN